MGHPHRNNWLVFSFIYSNYTSNPVGWEKRTRPTKRLWEGLKKHFFREFCFCFWLLAMGNVPGTSWLVMTYHHMLLCKLSTNHYCKSSTAQCNKLPHCFVKFELSWPIVCYVFWPENKLKENYENLDFGIWNMEIISLTLSLMMF